MAIKNQTNDILIEISQYFFVIINKEPSNLAYNEAITSKSSLKSFDFD